MQYEKYYDDVEQHKVQYKGHTIHIDNHTHNPREWLGDLVMRAVICADDWEGCSDALPHDIPDEVKADIPGRFAAWIGGEGGKTFPLYISEYSAHEVAFSLHPYRPHWPSVAGGMCGFAYVTGEELELLIEEHDYRVLYEQLFLHTQRSLEAFSDYICGRDLYWNCTVYNEAGKYVDGDGGFDTVGQAIAAGKREVETALNCVLQDGAVSIRKILIEKGISLARRAEILAVAPRYL